MRFLQAEQLETAKAARDKLQQEMISLATDHRRALEERVSAEVARIQTTHRSDMERLRQETIGAQRAGRAVLCVRASSLVCRHVRMASSHSCKMD